MLIISLIAAALAVLFLIFASGFIAKALAFLILAAAVYVVYRQFAPAPAALADVETQVVGAAKDAEKSIEEAINSTRAAVNATEAPKADAAPVVPVVPVAPVVPAAPVASSTDTPKA